MPMRFLAISLGLCLLLALSGCAGGLVGVIAALVNSGSGGGSTDLPPVLTDVSVSAPENPERINVDFRLSNEDQGRLGARVEVVKLKKTAGGGLEPDGEATPATPLPGSAPLEGIGSDQTVHFVWDARQDLHGGAAQVQMVLTPIEDGVEGKPFRTEVFRAGNTAPRIEDVSLFSQGTQVAVSFKVVDEESDPVTLEEVQIAVEGGDHEPVAREVFAKLLKKFPSAPGPDGAAGVFVFDIKDLAGPVNTPGFRGNLSVELSVRDFPSEEKVRGEGSFIFDNNEPPFIEMLPILEEDLASAVIPIRYRVFDRDLNPADIQIEVDLGDGGAFVPAEEFPSVPFEGRTQIRTLDTSLFGSPDYPFHTYFWDAGSQMKEEKTFVVAMKALDKEEGPRTLQNAGRPLLSGLVRAGEISVGDGPTALTSGDFDGDGFRDVVAANLFSDNVTYLRGLGGIGRINETGAGVTPIALICGDFDDDHFLDVVVANYDSSNVTYLRGGPGGLSRIGEIAAGTGPTALASGDFDGDGFPDLVVANINSNDVTYLHNRFHFPHPSSYLDPDLPASIPDPRNPPRYKLEVPAGALAEPTQVCLVPGSTFDLPQGEAFGRKKYLLAVTDPVSILRETSTFAGPARLTLRLRDHDPALLAEALAHPERLRVIRKDAGVAPAPIEIVDFGKAKGVAFPVTHFGAYVVALEKDR
jgi:VCBS repeat protein